MNGTKQSKNAIGSVKDAILGLLFPPKCIHCKETLGFRSREALCEKCGELWQGELVSVCKDCFLPVEMCECVPVTAGKSIKTAWHAVEYDPEKDNVTRSLILTSKDHNYRFMYEHIAKTLDDTLHTHTKSLKNVVIAYVPRSPKKVKDTGIDQAKITARLLAKRSSTVCADALIRKGSISQKSLDVEQRAKNARASYFANSKAIETIQGKTVILYDDVMTTGSTMAACADILKAMGAHRVICLTLARAYKKKRSDS